MRRIRETMKAKGEAAIREERKCAGKALLLGLILSLVFIVPSLASTPVTSTVEKQLTAFVKQFYGEDEIQVKFTNIPALLKGNIRVRNINFSKIPDGQGDGLCIVEYDGKEGRSQNVYVSFKVFKKRSLFVLNHDGKRGDTVTARDLTEKEAFLNGAGQYPASRDEIVGKRLKRDMQAGSVITPQVLEERILVQSGEIVDITAENPRLSIHASGKALDRGRMGELIRVRNLTSGKEVYGKVTGTKSVTVEF